MIIFIAAIIAALVAIAGLTYLEMTDQFTKHRKISITLLATFIFCFILTIGGIGATATTNIRNRSNLEDYNELALYYYVVSNSHDEALRWHYYAKAEEWNAEYQHYLEMNENPWVGIYYGANDYNGCDFVKLELHRD